MLETTQTNQTFVTTSFAEDLKDPGTHGSVVRTADVIGTRIVDLDGSDLGKVEEIVLDKISGQARYAVATFGGFMGIGSDYYSLPWKSLSYDVHEAAFKLTGDKNKLKTAPSFNKDNWPNFGDQTYNSNIDNYYSNL